MSAAQAEASATSSPAARAHRVLLVDDDPDSLGLLRRLCGNLGLAVDEALDAESALAIASGRLPDIVVTDLVLPGIDGIGLTERLKADPRFACSPVLVLSARRGGDTKIAALRAGATDFLEKPFDLAELEARLAGCIAQREVLDALLRSNWELRVANQRLSELATTDELTGLCNARHFRERLAEEFRRAERYQTQLSIIMTDLDGFKSVNDHHGHQAGDRLLAQVAQRLRQQARATDIAARYGGDEFAFILPHTAQDDAVVFASRLCHRLGDTPLRLADGRLAGVALSCGVASYLEMPGVLSASDLLAAADAALYEAKHAGGGVVFAASATMPPSRDPEPPRTHRRREMPRPRTPRGPGAA